MSVPHETICSPAHIRRPNNRPVLRAWPRIHVAILRTQHMLLNVSGRGDGHLLQEHDGLRHLMLAHALFAVIDEFRLPDFAPGFLYVRIRNRARHFNDRGIIYLYYYGYAVSQPRSTQGESNGYPLARSRTPYALVEHPLEILQI